MSRRPRPLRTLWTLVGARRGRWLGLLPLALAEVAVDGSLALAYRFLVDRAILPHDGRALAAIVAALAAAAVLATGLAFWRDRLYARALAATLAELRRRFHEACLRLPAAYFPAHASEGVLARFSGDLAGVEAWLASALNTLLLPLLNAALGAGLLFYLLPWRAALAVCLAWPLVLAVPRALAPRAARAQDAKKAHEEALLGRVQEAVGAHRLFKAYGLQDYARRRFKAVLEPFQAGAERAILLGLLVERSTVAAVYLAQVGALALGAWFAFTGRLSVGGLLAFLTVYWNLGWSLVVLARSAPGLLSALASARRVSDLLAEGVDPLETRGGRPLAPLKRGLRLEGLRFGYDPARPVLDGLDLEIRAGESLAVVGASGSGKSTLLGLLARFERPQAGRISYDGVDYGDAALASLRGRLGVVFQDSLLLKASARENVRAGRPEASDAEVEQACAEAGLDAALRSLPSGYDTALGEGGQALSGGQRQRLALARALLRRPSLLLLDEATSALDAASEAAILDTLNGLRGRCAQVSVTHRLAVAAQADRIAVLEGGRVAELGGHAQLLALGGLYARLCARQSGFNVASDGWSAEVTPARLAEVPLLAPLGPEELERLAPRFRSLHLGPGLAVLSEGEPGDLFYLLVRGRVSVSRRQPDGSQRELARLGDGDEFGELALLRDAPRSATVRTLTDCHLLALARENFLDLMGRRPGLKAVLEAVAEARSGGEAEGGPGVLA